MEITLVTFSPTHAGLTIGTALANGFATPTEDAVRCVDLTRSDPAEEEVIVKNMALFVVPVYGGRVAETAVERLRSLRPERAGQTPAIVAVVYGNRDYEDALVELQDIALEQGFVPLAAGAFVGEHSYSRPEEGMPIAQGRPDVNDLEIATRFGADARAKYDSAGTNEPERLVVKGGRPYKSKGPSTPATPLTEAVLCTGCGRCVEVCPTRVVALSTDRIARSEPLGCIKCCACVRCCPVGARRFETPYTEKLFTNCSARREPELFL